MIKGFMKRCSRYTEWGGLCRLCLYSVVDVLTTTSGQKSDSNRVVCVLVGNKMTVSKSTKPSWTTISHTIPSWMRLVSPVSVKQKDSGMTDRTLTSRSSVECQTVTVNTFTHTLCTCPFSTLISLPKVEHPSSKRTEQHTVSTHTLFCHGLNFPPDLLWKVSTPRNFSDSVSVSPVLRRFPSFDKE
jgi:hypothetical protein